MRSAAACLCAGLMALVLAACGGGGDGGSGGSGGPGGGGGTPALSGATSTTFGSQAIGTTSAVNSITLTSSGSAPVVFSTTTVSGPFVASGNCTGSLAVGAQCTLNMTFTPTAAGPVTGTVRLASNDPASPFQVSISATGAQAGWVPNQFAPSANFAAHCAVPRTGTNPDTGSPYADQPGTGLDERNWLRSWTNELYLWYREVVDRDPGLYTSNSAYFNVLRTMATTPSGRDKDQFHFSLNTSDWRALSQSGIAVGYGASFVVLAGAPPRNIVVAYTEPGSPAATAPASLLRGTRILTIDGVNAVSAGDQASINVLNAGLFPAAPGQSHVFSVLDPGAVTPRTVTLTSGSVTSVPVQNVKTISTASGVVGYMLFNDHLATSEFALVNAFTTLQGAGVTDLVLDLRYNGGGYLDIASEVGYMIAGPAQTAGRTFERTQFNDKHPTVNPVTQQAITPIPFHSTTQGFSLVPGQTLPTLNLTRVFLLTGVDTCSASESIINSLRGIDVQVVQIGSTTCGKPYGFYPRDNCGVTYFSIQMANVNAKGFGDYADGFSPANTSTPAGVAVPGCSVGDDFTHQLGDPAEARLAAALNYRSAAACPAATGFTMRALSAEREGKGKGRGTGRRWAMAGC